MDRGRGLCCCCLGTEDLHPLQSNLKQLFIFICSEDIDDKFILSVCPNCYKFLKEVYHFKRKCERVAKIIRNNTFDDEVALFIKNMENDYVKDENVVDITFLKTEIEVENVDFKTDENEMRRAEPFIDNNSLTNPINDETNKICNNRKKDRNKLRSSKTSNKIDTITDELKIKLKLPNNLRGVKKKKSDSSKLVKSDDHKIRKPRKRKHLSDKPFACDECSYRCTRPSNLKYHQRTHTGERPYLCKLCDYTCSSTSALRTHNKNKHSTAKPFSCDVCDYCSKTSTAMSNHKKLHYNIRDFRCDLCSYTSIQLAQLENHRKMIHTGERPFACDQCPYRGSNSNNLKCHMRSHLPIKKYSCNYCSHTCHTKSNLRSHIMTHTGEKPYECNICDFKYFNMSSLRRHRRKQHNVISEKES